MHDLLLLEEYCNLKCDYCEGFYPTEFEFKPKQEKLDMPDSWKMYRRDTPTIADKIPLNPSVTDFFSLGLQTLKKVDERFTYPVLKMSGGEVFLNRRFTDFVEAIAEDYQTIQILTNGLGIAERDVERFAEMGNIVFQMSVDGHTLRTNYARARTQKPLDMILQTIDLMQKKEIGVEINCVLTKHNTAEFGDFTEYFSKYDDVLLLPRPVRGPPRSVLEATPEQIRAFADFREKYDKHKHVLPPIAYFDRVISVLEKGNRSWDCWVPFFVLGVNNYGEIATCTCGGGLPTVGQVFEDDEKPFNIIKELEQYDPKSRLDPCSDCITQYEIFDLFMEDKITDDDLLRFPSLRSPEARAVTKDLKTKINEKGNKL